MEAERADMQQLYRQEPDGRGGRTKQPVFPTTLTRSVVDAQSGLTLDSLLRAMNSIYVDYRGTAVDTRNAVPVSLRRRGLVITYRDLYGVSVNERCDNDADRDTDQWGDDAHWVRLFYVGNEYVGAIDRGLWKEGEGYYSGTLNAEKGRYETSDVWYWGCKFRCLKTGTQEEPTWRSADWKMIEGNPTFRLDFEEPDTICDPEHFDITLTLTATLYNRNIIGDIDTKDILWTRYSLDSKGEERTGSDQIWNQRRGLSGKSIRLTKEDIDGETDFPQRLTFIARVTLRDAQGQELDTEYITYEY